MDLLANNTSHLERLFGRGVREIRVLSGDKFNSVYSAIEEEFVQWDDLKKSVAYYNKSSNCFITLNPLLKECKSKKQFGKTLQRIGSGDGITDREISCREWVLIDLDPERIKGVSSSDDEKNNAWETLKAVRTYLKDIGFSDPVVCDSGNGYHLLYRVLLKNTPEISDLISRFLLVLDEKFSSDKVKIDKKVFNAARIVKLYGTIARKGRDDDENGRPHRKSGFIEFPDMAELLVNDIKMIENVAGNAQERQQSVPTGGNQEDSVLFVRDFLEKHDIDYREKDKNGDVYFFLTDGCVFDPQHAGKDSCVIVNAEGKRIYKCFHDSCTGKHWADFVRLFEPEYKTSSERKEEAKNELLDTLQELANSVEYAKTAPRCFESDEKTETDTTRHKRVPMLNNKRFFGRKLEDCPYIHVKEGARKGQQTYEINATEMEAFMDKREHFVFVRDSMDGDDARLYRYVDGAYRYTSPLAMKGIIRGYLPVSLQTDRRISDIYRLMLCNGTSYPNSDFDADENVVNFKNGLLHVSTGEITPHTPSYLTMRQFSCDYVSAKKSEDHPYNKGYFDAYLKKLSGDNGKIVSLDRQYLGAIFSNYQSRRFKKALILVGKGNTGKSQLIALMTKLVGDRMSAGVSLKQLEESRFGVSLLYGKRFGGCGDSAFLRVDEMTMLKNLTGGDEIPCEFKGRDPFTMKYDGFLAFASNEYPKFGGDKGEWVYDRLLVQRCDNVVQPEEMDTALIDHMMEEREYILWRCLKEFRTKCLPTFQFIIPEEMIAWRSEYRTVNSSTLTFLKECCTVTEEDGEGENSVVLWAVYKAWCEDNLVRPEGKNKFFKDLEDLKSTGIHPHKRTSTRWRYYPNILINPETKQEYL